MKRAYDVVVVGAGPAGSVAARRFAAAGLDVLLVEKRQEIGVPVRCAEAIGAYVTQPFIDLNEKWIDAHIDTFAICGPEGDRVLVPPTEPTLVVNRKVFDFELALLAARAGAEVCTHVSVDGLLRDSDGRINGVLIRYQGAEREVHARLVIAADGTESQVARWAGLKSVPPLADYYVGYQYHLAGLNGNLVPSQCEYHLGQHTAPSGYIWVFPKGKDSANVGIVIGGDVHCEPPRVYLDSFVERFFPKSSRVSTVAGGIPATGAIPKMVTDGLLVVGDAAHQADPLTAGGINLGMIGADMAAGVGIEALAAGDVSESRLRAYEHQWHDRFKRQHSALYQIRKILGKMDDSLISDMIRTVAHLPPGQLSTAQIIARVLRHHPRLLLEAQKLIATGLILK